MNVVVMLTRVPGAAPMKTRLLAALGRPGDEALVRALLLDTLDGVRQVGARVVVAFEPAGARPHMAALAPGVLLVEQRGADLAERMTAAIDDQLAAGASRVVLVGSDVPALSPAYVARAFAALADRPDSVVLGPTADGGYALVGMTRPRYGIFEAIPWGTASVMEETRRRARRLGIPTVELPQTRDVDTPDALQDLLATDATIAPAPRTRAWAAQHGLGQ